MTQPVDPHDAESPAASALGAELKQLRLRMPTDTSRTMTQEQMAGLILVGGKGVVSQIESGKRLPDEATIQRYVTATGTLSVRLG